VYAQRWLGIFRRRELAGFVDFIPAEAKVGSAHVAIYNMSALLADLPALLRRIVFLGQPHLGTGTDGSGSWSPTFRAGN
jgi:hypothetical protein